MITHITKKRDSTIEKQSPHKDFTFALAVSFSTLSRLVQIFELEKGVTNLSCIEGRVGVI